MTNTDTSDPRADKHAEGLRAQIRGHGIDPATIDIAALADATRNGAVVALDPEAPGGFRAEHDTEHHARLDRAAQHQAERGPSFDQLDHLAELEHDDGVEHDDEEPEL